MIALLKSSVYGRSYVLIAIVVLLACIGLFSLDKEMHAASDFLKPVNLAALVLYVLPTIGICMLLFHGFFRRFDSTKSAVLALITGIPLGFALVIYTILTLRP